MHDGEGILRIMAKKQIRIYFWSFYFIQSILVFVKHITQLCIYHRSVWTLYYLPVLN